MRKHGISVLIASQNEEITIESCVLSFLDFGDEIIVVDNGSQDKTLDILKRLQKKYPEKISIFHKPNIRTLSENRQFALEQSSFNWIFRCDADFIAYTTGSNSIMCFREELLSRKKSFWPEGYYVPQINVVGDFWHTGKEFGDLNGYSKPILRFYRHYPGMRFQRRGRWEGVRWQNMLKKIEWQKPLWMHCSLKSDMNFFLRSERTNWRENGDFKKYPSIEAYIAESIEERYGTIDFHEAAKRYVHEHVLPHLTTYNEEKFGPYPDFVKKQMSINPGYKIWNRNGIVVRAYLGIQDELQ